MAHATTNTDPPQHHHVPDIEDLAQEAGVTRATVAKALYLPESVAPRTFARIAAAANRIGFPDPPPPSDEAEALRRVVAEQDAELAAAHSRVRTLERLVGPLENIAGALETRAALFAQALSARAAAPAS